MSQFLARHQSQVKGVLSGWDRLRFRGSLRPLSYVDGLMQMLSWLSVLLKDFGNWAESLTDQLRGATKKLAETAGRPVIYLSSSHVRKEDRAREILERDGITHGLIAVLTCLEPCLTWQVRKQATTQRLVLERIEKKCLFQYFYFLHPQWGLMHVRLQTWIPFTIQVCLNGREWLAEDLKRLGIPFEKRENCFVDVADLARAQQLLDLQRQTDWISSLSELVSTVHPTHAQMFGPRPPQYYWSASETEWATDVLFRSPEALAKVYQPFLKHGVTTYQTSDVLRFFGRRPLVKMLRTATVETHLGTRAEGTRIKHHLDGNTLKMYDKQGSVLRVETTLNNPASLKVQRGTEQNPDDIQLRPMRKAAADMARRADACQSINERYLESLAAVSQEEPLQQTIAPLCRATQMGGRRVRALSPLSAADAQLLTAINRPEFLLHGFRNRDLRELLFAGNQTLTAKQQAGKVTRLIRLLRAHGLIRKVRQSHRYQVSATGRIQITAILAAQQATTLQLTQLAV